MTQSRFIREAIEAEATAAEWYDGQAADEARRGEAYTRKWHAVYDWGFEMLEWDSPADWLDNNPRVTRIRAAIVKDVENEEEAYKKAIPVERIDEWLGSVDAPGRVGAARRRVVIRLFTWVIDRENRVAYDGEWLKIGDDMTPRAAVARAIRWAESYAESLLAETASREIRMTQVEIVFWTTGDAETVV